MIFKKASITCLKWPQIPIKGKGVRLKEVIMWLKYAKTEAMKGILTSYGEIVH